MKNLWIERVCGRVHEDAAGLEVPPEMEVPERQSRETYDEEIGNRPADGKINSESIINNLLQAWHNGERQAVAAQILFTPISYADFAKFVYALGQEDAVQLGLMLDEMSESEGIGPDTSHDRVLRKVAGGPTEAPGPTSPEALVPEGGAEALPPPPTEEPEEEPHDVGTQLEQPR